MDCSDADLRFEETFTIHIPGTIISIIMHLLRKRPAVLGYLHESLFWTDASQNDRKGVKTDGIS